MPWLLFFSSVDMMIKIEVVLYNPKKSIRQNPEFISRTQGFIIVTEQLYSGYIHNLEEGASFI